MTKREFVDGYYDAEDLANGLLDEYGYEVVTVYSADDMNTYVEDWIREQLNRDYWYDIIPRLEYIDRDYEYYIIEDIDNIVGYFNDDLLELIIERLEDEGFFDDDEEEEEEIEEEYNPDDEPFEVGDFNNLI